MTSSDARSLEETLSQVPIFAKMPSKSLRRLASSAHARHCAAGDMILNEGEPGIALYVLASGEAEVIRGLQHEKPQIVATLHAGDFFGEMALLETYVRTASVKALNDCECVTLTKWDFMAELRRTPDIAVEMLPVLGQRIREARLALGLTQEQLAKPEFTKGFISQLEHDQTRPSISTLEHLARKLRRPISYFVEAVDGATTRKVLDSQNSRGRSELARRHFDAALATFTDMRTTASSPSHALMETQATLGVGEALVGLNRFAEARPCLQDAAACGRAAKDALMECRALHGLATIEHRTGQFTQAALLFREALAVVPALGGAEPSLHGEIWTDYAGGRTALPKEGG